MQPVFSETDGGALRLEALEGLIRVSRDGMPCPATEFFAAVDENDRARVDSLCRSLHILNAGALGRRETLLIVKFHPGAFPTEHAIRHELDRMRVAGHEAGLRPAIIACEIRERPDDDAQVLARFAALLRDAGLRVAIDGYAGEDRDMALVRRLRPDLVKLDAAWVRTFSGNSAGLALMRVIVRQFIEGGARPVFCGIEEPWQIDLCREIGAPLMQGYLLARPEIAPTTFNLHFPEDDPSTLPQDDVIRAAERTISAAQRPAPNTGETHSRRPPRKFGRRGL